jgi:imidazolonepropionase-like amidohydrolase
LLRVLAFATALAVATAGCSSGSDDGTRPSDAADLAAPPALVITAGRLFDGRRIITNGAVRIEDRRVAAVGPATEMETADARLLDLGDATILPGLIDTHVHTAPEDYAGIARTGVTTVRDLGSPEVIDPAEPRRRGLRLWSAGRILTAPGGAAARHFSHLAEVVRNPREARRAVAAQLADGADVVKLYLAWDATNRYPLLTVRQIRAAARRAHRAGVLVSAHMDEARGIRRGLAGGVDEFAHSPCYKTPGRVFRRALEEGWPMIATLHTYEGCPFALANARRYVRLGGRLLYGSDMGNTGIPKGLDPRELELLVEAGYSNRQVILAATRWAASHIGLKRGGRLVVGSPGDVVAVSGDPFASLSALEDPRLVVSGGRIILSR